MIIQIRPIIFSFEAPFQQIVSYGKSENPRFPRSSIDSSLESIVFCIFAPTQTPNQRPEQRLRAVCSPAWNRAGTQNPHADMETLGHLGVNSVDR